MAMDIRKVCQIIVCGVGPVLVVGTWEMMPSESEADVRHEMCDSQVGDRMAYDNAQDQVLKVLKAPPTAKFPDFSEVTVVRHPDCSFDVSGYVDAQNGFGAMIRSTWTDKVVYAGHDAKGYHHSVARALID
jgi:hypothetical protein